MLLFAFIENKKSETEKKTTRNIVFEDVNTYKKILSDGRSDILSEGITMSSDVFLLEMADDFNINQSKSEK